MATSQQIATKALRRIRVVAAEDTAAAADIEAAKEALADIIASWEAEGLSGDVLPLSDRFEQAIVAMLAVRLAEDYGKTPGPVLLRDASEGWDAIKAAYFVVPKSTFDAGLVVAGPRNDEWGYAATSKTVSEWLANNSYSVRQFVTYLGNEYECTTAGTSGSSGPTGTDTTITDGTVTWCWRRAVE
jgi:hypothetical protein